VNFRQSTSAYHVLGLPYMEVADPGGREVQGVGLQQIYCWNRGFESRWGHGCASLVFVVKAVASATSWSLVQGSPTVCVFVSNCVWSGKLDNEAAQARLARLRHKKRKVYGGRGIRSRLQMTGCHYTDRWSRVKNQNEILQYNNIC
jgi:hypothetical protein